MYRNPSIDLLCKLMDWFLFDKDIHHERVKTLFTHHTSKDCSYMLYSRISFLFFFFYQGFFSWISWFKGQQGEEKAISLTPLYHFHQLHRYLDISQVIAAERWSGKLSPQEFRTSKSCFPSKFWRHGSWCPRKLWSER